MVNPVDVTISSFTYFILPNINDDYNYGNAEPIITNRITTTVLTKLHVNRLSANGGK